MYVEYHRDVRAKGEFTSRISIFDVPGLRSAPGRGGPGSPGRHRRGATYIRDVCVPTKATRRADRRFLVNTRRSLTGSQQNFKWHVGKLVAYARNWSVQSAARAPCAHSALPQALGTANVFATGENNGFTEPRLSASMLYRIMAWAAYESHASLMPCVSSTGMPVACDT